MRVFESDVDGSGARGGRDAGGTGRGVARAPGALLLLAGVLLVAGCGGGDDECVNCPNGDGNVETLDMAVGEVVVRDAGSEVLALELPAGSEGRMYDVAVQVDSRAVGTVPMRLRVAPSSGASGSVAPAPNRAAAFDRRRIGERWTRARDLAMRLAIQENAKRLLRDRNVPPARRATASGPRAPRFSSMLPGSTPSPGDTLEFWYPVQPDFDIACSTDSAQVVAGEVRAVGQRAVMVEDTTVNSGLLSESMNYDSLAQAFDDEVFGTDVEYFGEPSDIDGNGRVYVLFTNAVNRLSDPEEEGIVTGFFLPTDLADSGDPTKDGFDGPSCQNSTAWESSNEAEVLYLLAPDPDGSEGDSVSVATAKRSAGGTSSHEFQHLLNAANRVIGQQGTFADLEDTWLDEGLSHVAEEVVGLDLTGDPVRSNLTLADVTENQREVDVFNTFHLPNFARLAEYMRSPQDTRALVAGTDPGGLESLKMRGFAWTFLRWLADQEATASAGPVPGSGEEAFVRDLAKADGGLETGIENIEAASGASWTVLLEDFGLAPAVDDTVSGVDPRLTVPTWDLRDIYLGLHDNSGTQDVFPEEYPLDLTTNGFAADTVDFEVQGATQKYFRFDGSGASGSVVLRLSNQSGAALGASSGARFLIVRTR